MMADITMCTGERMNTMRANEVCPLRETCYRYKAPPSPWRQSYWVNPPWEGKECAEYWKVDPPTKTKKKQ